MISAKIMGRWHYSNRKETYRFTKIDIRWFKKEGLLKGFCDEIITFTNSYGEKRIRAVVSLQGNAQCLQLFYGTTNLNGGVNDYCSKIPITTTPCHLGGKRHWFECSLSAHGIYCGRRVAILYLKDGYFACRRCHDLTYRSQKENRRYKTFPLFHVIDISEKIDKIEAKKHLFYAGKPTRRLRQIEKLNKKMCVSYRKYEYSQDKGENLSPPKSLLSLG